MPSRRNSKSAASDDELTVDQRFAGYIDVACNLDGLLWRNQATLLGITVLGWGAVALTLEKQLRFAPLSHTDTLAAILVVTGLLYCVTLIAKARMRFWHLKIEAELARLEKRGYFVERQTSPSYLSAVTWSIFFFGAMAVLMLGAAVFLFIASRLGALG